MSMRASASSSSASTLVRGVVLVLLVLGLVPMLGAQPVAAQNSSITVNSHTCPYDTNMSLSYGDLANICTGIGEFEYVMNGPSGIVQQATFGGSTTYSGLVPSTPGNPYYITQNPVSPTYGPPTAFCTVYDAGGTVVNGPFVTNVSNAQTPIELAVDGHYAVCDVYNAEAEATPPPATGGDAEVYVSKWACPEGTTSTDFADLEAACTTEMEGVTFTIRDFADDAQSDDTGGQPARASFTDWKTGGATITETIPQGYGEPVVYCYAQDEFGTVFPGYELALYEPSNGTISIDVPTDPNGGLVSFFCEWFNIPGATGGGDDADVFISKWACPEGYYSSDYADLQAECTTELEGVEFTIEDSAGESQTDDTGGQPARAAFTPWKSGSATITEAIPDGYGEPVVFCWAYDDFGEYLPGYEPAYFPSTDGTISVEIPPPTGDYVVTFECDWYNVTDTEHSGIYIHKFGCPQDADTDWDQEELAERCLTIVRAATFTVSGPEDFEEEQTTSGIDVTWEGLPSGEYTIAEEPASGYRDMVVYCALGSYDADTGAYDQVELEDGGFTQELAENEYLDCFWYNIPAPRSTTAPRPSGPATIIIVKYTCPDDYDVFKTGANPVRECDETTDGVTFTLQGGRNTSATRVTGEDDEEDGTATFEEVPAGSYLLKETYPERVRSAFVWDCTSDVRTFDYPFAPFAMIGPDATIKVSVVPGETLECSWYDVPTSERTATVGNVRVTVRDCPSQQVNRSQCEPAEGARVTLTADDGEGEPTEIATDDDGLAVFSVDPGSFLFEVSGGACLTDSEAFEDDDTLVVGDEPVTVEVFRCAVDDEEDA